MKNKSDLGLSAASKRSAVLAARNTLSRFNLVGSGRFIFAESLEDAARLAGLTPTTDGHGVGEIRCVCPNGAETWVVACK
jgi:hypothetical protein